MVVANPDACGAGVFLRLHTKQNAIVTKCAMNEIFYCLQQYALIAVKAHKADDSFDKFLCYS